MSIKTLLFSSLFLGSAILLGAICKPTKLSAQQIRKTILYDGVELKVQNAKGGESADGREEDDTGDSFIVITDPCGPTHKAISFVRPARIEDPLKDKDCPNQYHVVQ